MSVDGATTGFEPDVARFYELAARWEEDVTLAGADTILAQEEALREAPRRGPAVDGPLLAVVDGRARVREWEALRDCGHWSDVVALRGEASPEPGAPRELVTGGTRVDLGAALRVLAQRESARTVRVDSGGTLTGALLGAGLVDEVSLLVHPVLAGAGATHRWHGAEPAPAAALEQLGCDALDHGLVWLRYRVPS